MLRNLVKRKNIVIDEFKKDADKELERKALVDLFDVRFMPLNFTPDEFQDE